MFVTILFIMAKSANNPISINRRTENKLWYIHSVVYHSVNKQTNKTSDTHNNKNETQKYNVSERSQTIKYYILNDCLYLNRQN